MQAAFDNTALAAHTELPAASGTCASSAPRDRDMPPRDPLRLALPSATPEELRTLARIGRHRRCAAGTEPLRCDMPATALWLLERGQLSIGVHDAQGRWRQTRRVEPGHWVDATSAWLGGCHAEGALAETDVELVELPLLALEAVLPRHPQLWRALLACSSHRAHQAIAAQHALLLKDVVARLADWLLATQRGGEVLLLQHKRSLASQLGMTPETLSRTLGLLRSAGVIEDEPHRIGISDAAALRRCALHGSAALAPERPSVKETG